ncbi:NAD-dependent epimerase/dehydratase family protein [Dactylosporangium sp. AC04546]|uniref:NAD-dependent epimerase/dehydratase family protein n=1 Tax=Dactylosporangium sp. AC04546 TaxID=2862460 RepID=UPI001EE10D37|nr:NAD-dependent epimerase/dehydratase family protein [Dactylosporangium sp. AC04546]WVK80806.1 NAD-dependent epimerase/dehydratase family protein [Dactylosporangium sp. AC04546]
MRILVTGGAGFIGTHVVTALRAAGHDAVAFDSLHPAAHGGGDPVPGDVLRADVRDAAAVADALAGVDVVVHQAAMVGMGVDLADLPDYVGCNDLGTAVLLAGMARAGVRRLVLASSMVVYGEGSYSCPRHGSVQPAPRRRAELAAGRFDPPCPACGTPLVPGEVGEDAPLRPRSVYAATKTAQEHLAAAWAAACDGAVIALRYHNVYGPGMPRDTPYSGVAAIFRSALEAGRPARVFEDGAQRRDFVHVDDVAHANVLAADATETTGFRPYNIASGHPTTIAAMAVTLADAMAGPAPVVTGEHRPGDVRHIVASAALARRDLGFTARVGPTEGLRAFATASLRPPASVTIARGGPGRR